MSADFDTRLERAKLDAMKELAYGASHEINNPLANISARAQTLLRDEPHPERRNALEAIRQQAMRAHEMIADLMLFARPPALDPQPIDLTHWLTNVVDSVSSVAEQNNIRVTLTLPETVTPLTADEQQLTVAVTAVITNAIEAIGSDGTVEIGLRQDPVATTIDVTDSGPGISDAVREHLFDPFYSGREAGRGLGFGLSKCWRIVTEHGGSVAVSSEVGRGTMISLVLPADGSKQTGADA